MAPPRTELNEGRVPGRIPRSRGKNTCARKIRRDMSRGMMSVISSESPFSQEAMEDDEGKLSNKNNKCSSSDPDVAYQPTCVVNSWGHFSQCVKNRYKYRRSDYSSESDEEHGIPQWPNKPDIVQPQKSHLPSCDLNSLTSVLKPKEASKNDVIKNIASRTKDGIKPTVFKEKLAVSFP